MYIFIPEHRKIGDLPALRHTLRQVICLCASLTSGPRSGDTWPPRLCANTLNSSLDRSAASLKVCLGGELLNSLLVERLLTLQHMGSFVYWGSGGDEVMQGRA